MKLNDIWRNVNYEIGFFTKETFKKVPKASGVYAWFYPLRVTTSDPFQFLNEVNSVINYDFESGGKPLKKLEYNLNWKKIKQTLEIEYTVGDIQNFIKTWELYAKSDESFDKLRAILMRASIFMPPLYVGKTNNLHTRCKQHIAGSSKNDFNKRFTDYAIQLNLPKQQVSDLLFVSIKTNEFFQEQDENLELLVESILKTLSKPIYSIL